jgi:predicted amidohydrolase
VFSQEETFTFEGATMNRRIFLRNAAVGMSTLADIGLTGLKAEELDPDRPAVDPAKSAKTTWGDGVGRPVRVASIGFRGHVPLEKMAGLVDEEGARGTDIIVLPELSRGLDKGSQEPLHGPTVTAMSALAKKHKTYIACPIDRRDGSRRLNSVVLLDRSGMVVCVYDKVFPYWSEYNVQPAVDPGNTVHVHQADFGPVGFATCFDANFPEVWKDLSDKGAELVIWPSAYSAGMSLQAHAINHHYYIVTCSQTPDCIVYDITGERILHEAAAKDFNISRVTLDLDRVVFHENFNLPKRDKLLSERPQDVTQESWLRLEQWFVLRAKRPGVSARDLAREYGLEELRHYLDRSRVAIDQRRGWEFAEETVFPPSDVADLQGSVRKPS